MSPPLRLDPQWLWWNPWLDFPPSPTTTAPNLYDPRHDEYLETTLPTYYRFMEAPLRLPSLFSAESSWRSLYGHDPQTPSLSEPRLPGWRRTLREQLRPPDPSQIRESPWVAFIVDLLTHFETADLMLGGIPVNDHDGDGHGEGGCRYPEYRQFEEWRRDGPGPCNIFYEPGTTATARAMVREIRRRDESIIDQFTVAFSESADFQLTPGVPILSEALETYIQGFYATSPRDWRASDPFPQACYQLFDGRCEARRWPAMGQTVLRPAVPYFILHYGFEDGLISGALAEGAEATGRSTIRYFLTAFGLNDAVHGDFRGVGVPEGTFPRSVAGFMTLMRPLFTRETREERRALSTFINPNRYYGNGQLLDWLGATSVEVQAYLRPGRLHIPSGNLRLIDFQSMRRFVNEHSQRMRDLRAAGDTRAADQLERDLADPLLWLQSQISERSNYLEVEGNSSQLRVALHSPAIPEINIAVPRNDLMERPSISLRMQTLLAGRAELILPPFHQLFRDPLQNTDPIQLRFGQASLSGLALRFGRTRVRLRNLRAASIILTLPSPAEIEAQHLSGPEIFARARIQLSMVAAERVDIRMPGQDLELQLRNVSLDHLNWNNGQLEIDAGRAGRIHLESARFGNLDIEQAELTGFQLNLASTSSRLLVRRVRARSSLEFQTQGETAFSGRLAGNSEIRGLDFAFHFAPGEERHAEIHFNLGGELASGTLRTPWTGEIQIGEASIPDLRVDASIDFPPGSLAPSDYSATLQGDFSFHIERISDVASEFAIPGFHISADLEDVRISGHPRLSFSPRMLVLESSGEAQTVSAEADLVDTRIRHRPEEHDPRLRRIHDRIRRRLRSRAPVDPVETDFLIHHAHLQVEDLERLVWRFVPERAGDGETSSDRPAGLQEIDLSGVRITALEATGDLWAPLPPWRYLRARLAIGRTLPPEQLEQCRPRELPPMPVGGSCEALAGGIPVGIPQGASFLFLGDLRIEGGSAHLVDLRTCLQSEITNTLGHRPYFILGIPEITFHTRPLSVEAPEEAPIHLDACASSCDRTGMICLTPAAPE